VLVTSHAMPYAGGRTVNGGLGMSASRAIVVGREWDFEAGVGRLTLLVTGLEAYGYAPTGRLASASGSGTSWTLTLEATHYAPAGVADASYFRAGDDIAIREWNANTPTIRTGVVVSVSGNDVAVTLDSSWAGIGGSTWTLVAGPSDEASASQLERFAYVANSQLRIGLASSASTRAREFAP
jgi:hypothetical protein